MGFNAKLAERLYDNGLNDTEIGELCGVCKTTVRSWRRRTGRASNYYGPAANAGGEWAVYRAADDTLLTFGGAQECADRLGIKLHAFYQLCSRARRGIGHKYRVYYTPCKDVRRSFLADTI